MSEGATSPPSPVTSGVPQGSVLGPLLFLTYINDLPNGLTSTVKLFADDTLLYGMVVDDSDCDNLQEDVNKLEIWQHEWQMQFNPSKCNIICISNKQRPPQRTYFFCGSKLEQVDSASYLGITVNRKLKWSEHISSILTILGVDQEKSLELPQESTWNGLYQHRPTQTGVRKCLVEPILQKRYFNLRESPKKSCSFLPAKLQQNSKCDGHVIWSELGLHIRNKEERKTDWL